MNTLLVSLVTIAIIDSLNPTSTATAVQLYLLSTPKPVVRSASFIIGFLISHWLIGWLIVIEFGQAIASLVSTVGLLSDAFIYLVQFAIGIALIVVGWNLTRSRRSKAIHRATFLKPGHALLLGFGATLWKLPTALLYLAAIEQIVRAKLTVSNTMIALATYNLVLILPIVILLGIYITSPKKSLLFLRLINQLITKWIPQIFRVLLVGVGCVLIANCLVNILGLNQFQNTSVLPILSPIVLQCLAIDL